MQDKGIVPKPKELLLYRQWYHIRTKHPTESLEAFEEDCAEAYNGQEQDVPDISFMENIYIVDGNDERTCHFFISVLPACDSDACCKREK